MATCNKAGRHIFMARKKETRAVSATYIIDILKISDIIISWENFSDYCEDYFLHYCNSDIKIRSNFIENENYVYFISFDAEDRLFRLWRRLRYHCIA